MHPQQQQQPILVLNPKTERQQGRKAQLSNIMAAKAVADVVRTCLGPQAMLKMLMDPMGGIVLTSDGNAILREIDVAHPAAKTILELSRAQDEEVGDGTTSVVVLAGELLAHAAPLVDASQTGGIACHPISIIGGYRKALEDSLAILDSLSKPISLDNNDQLREIVATSIETKAVCASIVSLIVDLAVRSVRCVGGGGEEEEKKSSANGSIDIKRFARVEKIPGGQLEESQVLDGVMLNKDVVHPAMARQLKNPRVLLLDCPLEYKKGESQTNMELTDQEAWNKALEREEEEIKRMCDHIISLKPDIIVTEKGLSDLAQHFLVRAGISALRRVRKTDNQRIARACNARIVTRVEDATPADIGLGCGLFRVDKVGDEYFSYFVECQNPKACTIVLRGPSKDILNEVERCLHDAMCVTRNLLLLPSVVPGAGACEMAISIRLVDQAASVPPSEQLAYRTVARALEVVPRTLIQNCGSNPIRVLSELRAKLQADLKVSWSIDGHSGKVVEGSQVWEPLAVKRETLKTAIEAACLLLRVDEIVSGIRNPNAQRTSSNEEGQEE